MPVTDPDGCDWPKIAISGLVGLLILKRGSAGSHWHMDRLRIKEFECNHEHSAKTMAGVSGNTEIAANSLAQDRRMWHLRNPVRLFSEGSELRAARGTQGSPAIDRVDPVPASPSRLRASAAQSREAGHRPRTFEPWIATA
jgi:hypothetical protein